MTTVRIQQLSAHLAGPVVMDEVSGANGPIKKASFIAISNSVRGSGEARSETATVIRWTLWGALAVNACAYLSTGSHVNILGIVRNNNYTGSDEAKVYGFNFVAEEVDFLDTKERSEALRAKQDGTSPAVAPAPQPAKAPSRKAKAGA